VGTGRMIICIGEIGTVYKLPSLFISSSYSSVYVFYDYIRRREPVFFNEIVTTTITLLDNGWQNAQSVGMRRHTCMPIQLFVLNVLVWWLTKIDCIWFIDICYEFVGW
jgi:hypothetical protein